MKNLIIVSFLSLIIFGCKNKNIKTLDSEISIEKSKANKHMISEQLEEVEYMLVRPKINREETPNYEKTLELEYEVKIHVLRDTIRINVYSMLEKKGWEIISGKRDFEIVEGKDWNRSELIEKIRSGVKVVEDISLIYEVKPKTPLYTSNGKGYINIPLGQTYVYTIDSSIKKKSSRNSSASANSSVILPSIASSTLPQIQNISIDKKIID